MRALAWKQILVAALAGAAAASGLPAPVVEVLRAWLGV